ncbi:MAG TPA: substrate-binding domain-containing protein [Pseudonocardiaceae bacterium]|nr:substrate-binding domain-containing protein [Pseudonocardiaceae bacterium]
MSFSDAVQSIVDVLGSNQGTISLGVAAAVAIGSPIVDRLLIRRKRIQYQVLYNSKIGLSPIFLGDDTEEDRSVPANPQLTKVVNLLVNLSVVIVRIRNTGSYDIVGDDFQPPLSFTFGQRVVWDARISEASDEQLRRHVRENLEFFTNADAPARHQPPTARNGAPDYQNLPALRRWLAPRLSAWLAPAPTPVVLDSTQTEPQWHGVRLARLWLRRNQSFILVVVLREADEKAAEITKEYEVSGGHSTGRTIIDEKRQHRFGWPLIVSAIGVMLVGALLATLIIGRHQQTNPGVPCTPGTVTLDGSSAFGPTVRAIGDKYTSGCPGAHVVVGTSGSIDGVRTLVQDTPQQAAGLAALSDGAAAEPTPGLDQQLVAVLVYSVVINRDVGIDQLSAGQLAGIYSGRYTNWSQLHGPSLPIVLVSRTSTSGTRRTFEQSVLHGSEGPPSSVDCRTKDDPKAVTTECELDRTDDVVNTVAATPGAIGYADVANQTTKTAVRGGRIVTVKLGGLYPQLDSLPNYPFWTVEHLYTRGKPRAGSPLAAFLDYLSSDSAETMLLSAGYTPCVPRDGVLNPLCARH